MYKRREEWWDESCWLKKKAVRLSLRQFREAKEGELRLVKRREYCEAKWEFKKLCKEKKKESMNKWIERVKEVKTEGGFWELVNRGRNRYGSGVARQIKEEEWVSYFAELVGGEGEIEGLVLDQLQGGEDGSRITKEEVVRAIRKLRRGRRKEGIRLKMRYGFTDRMKSWEG